MLAIMVTVSGEYWQYVPLFVHSINHAYPEYMPVILGRGGIPADVSAQIHRYNLQCDVTDRALDCYDGSAWAIKSLRWLIAPEKYKAVYITDVDFLIIREPEGILESHLIDCVKEGLCYSNTIHSEGLERGIRMMGMHFYVTEPYMMAMESVLGKYRHMLSADIERLRLEWHNPALGVADNQYGLYRMIVEARLGLPQEMYNPFRTYHGVHLGHSREPGRWEAFASKPSDFGTMPGPIGHYYHHFLELESTAKYRALYEAAPDFVTGQIDTFEKACELTL